MGPIRRPDTVGINIVGIIQEVVSLDHVHGTHTFVGETPWVVGSRPIGAAGIFKGRSLVMERSRFFLLCMEGVWINLNRVGGVWILAPQR